MTHDDDVRKARDIRSALDTVPFYADGHEEYDHYPEQCEKCKDALAEALESWLTAREAQREHA